MINNGVNIELYQLLINSSLFVLIWIVQLVVYPGFTHYQEKDIKGWHPVYSRRITYIVMPLMLSQLGLYIHSTIQEPSIINISIMILIVLIWVITFLIAVPLHGLINRDDQTIDHRVKLVRVNWPRTIAWTFILIISLIGYGT